MYKKTQKNIANTALLLMSLLIIVSSGCYSKSSNGAENQADIEKGIEKNSLKYIKINKYRYKEYLNKKDESVLIYIPAGDFVMGSNEDEPDERPEHMVYLEGYYIMKYEVTNKQYKKFCDETGRKYPDDPEFVDMENYLLNYPNYPVVNVSFIDAQAYSVWAGLRLPDEAEWEKAARGMDSRKYPWGADNPGNDRANFNAGEYTEDGFRYTSPVGVFKNGASPCGCYDMAGNVWEWCNGKYNEAGYTLMLESDTMNMVGLSYKILRGGTWHLSSNNLRCSNRDYDIEDAAMDDYGFRCAGD